MFDVSANDPFPAPTQNDEEGMRFYLKRMLTWAESVGIKVISKNIKIVSLAWIFFEKIAI